MRNLSKYFFLFSLFCLLNFTSCNNVFENSISSEEEQNTSVPEQPATPADRSTPTPQNPAEPAADLPEFFTFGGSLRVNGAMPAQMVQAQQNTEEQVSSRSANPTIPNTSAYEYYIRATSTDGLSHESTIDATETTINYTLQLETRKTWSFVAGLRKKATGTPGQEGYVGPQDILIDYESDSGHPYVLALTETVLTNAETKTFILKPLQTSGGSGTIDLSMTIPSDLGITSLKLFRTGADGVAQLWQPAELEVTLNHIKTTENMTIASGSYEVTMIFYRHDDTLNTDFQAFITYQTINVFDGMHTSVWVSEVSSSTASVITGNTFQLTTNLLQNFASSTIYVGAPAGVPIAPNDDYVGSPYAPLLTLTRAFNIIQANSSGDGSTRDYRIFVTTAAPVAGAQPQLQQANYIIPTGITSAKAKSIEIIGLGSGDNQATLNPDATNPGTVLTINTAVPVKLSNIKITGGQGRDNGNGGTLGGGLVILGGNDGANVTLNAGTKIISNTASDIGGGIYIKGANSSNKPKLTIKNDVEIKSNTITGEGSGKGGMAIFAECAEVTMSGGEISGNSKTGDLQYGAVRLTDASEFTMTGGTVANNDGGAFYVDSTYDSGTNSYTHSKLKLGGSATIPFGVNGVIGQTQNDVYIVRANPTSPDGGEYSPVEIASAITAAAETKIATLTPDGWQRGLEILKTNSGVINTYKGYFKTTDNDFSFTNQVDALTSKLNAPIVVSSDSSKNPSNTNSGTRAAPYATLAYALSQLGGGVEATILIDGTLSGAQSIGDTFTTAQCSALTLKGANGLDSQGNPLVPNSNPEDKLTIPSGTEASVLTVDTAVPVIIENLKITGGNSDYGGGIKIDTGTVKLGDRALVSGNTASYGGGVYLAGMNARLFMYGSSLIGDSVTSTVTAEGTDSTTYANKVSRCGGGIYNSAGKVYIGYSGLDGSTPVKCDMAAGYGVRRNYASSSNSVTQGGGGIYNAGGLLQIASGSISFNQCEKNVQHDTQADGGGIYNYDAMGNAVIIEGPVTEANKLVMAGNKARNGGAIYSQNSITISAGEFGSSTDDYRNVAEEKGGAVYVATGTFSIGGSAKLYFANNSEKYNDIYLAADKTVSISADLIETTVATITATSWTRGTAILSGTTQLLNDNKGKFKLSQDDDGWFKETDSTQVKINSPYFVSGSSGGTVCSAPTGSASKGLKSNPFASVAQALSFFGSGTTAATITIDGTVTGAQSISGSFNPTSVTLTGYDANATLDAEGASGTTTLTVDASSADFPVTIENLKITGGNAVSDGGGINLKKGTLKLVGGAKIYGNKAINGGGLYIAGGSTVYMSGTALVGSSTASAAPESQNQATSAGSNTATLGGGIYNAGSLYLGTAAATLTGGVNGNFTSVANGYGGGIYNANNLYLNSGNIMYNGTAGAYGDGAGVYNLKTFAMNAGTISGNQAKGSSSAGGGVYCAVTTGSTSAFTMGGGSISGNKAVQYGGGVNIAMNNASFTLSGGSISSNQVTGTAGTGNGICLNHGTFNVQDNAEVASSNDVYLAAGETITVTGTLNKSTVATVTPNQFIRGRDIVSAASSITIDKSKFALSQDNDGWNKEDKTVSNINYVCINSPIYVAGSTGRLVCSAPPESGANGIKTKPFATIEAALSLVKDKDLDYTIEIDGTVTGSQSLPTTLTDGSDGNTTYMAKSLLVKGTNGLNSSTHIPKDSINTSTSGKGRVLTVQAKKVPVTIKDLLLTGAEISGSGGGIYVSGSDTVLILSDGAVVNGNTAEKGGGVYLYSGNLFLNGSAVVGKPGTVSSCAGTTTGTYANKATLTGGGISVESGALWLGYRPPQQSETQPQAVDTSGGVIYNLVASSSGACHGGGIDNNQGTVHFAKGNVKYNYAHGPQTGDTDVGSGGGISTANTFNLKGDAVISDNKAADGGGVYITTNSGNLVMTGGTISSNTATRNGGAIYQGSTFNVSGSATVSSGSEKNNDVYLPSEKVVTINSNYNGSGNNTSNKMALTPANWTRGSYVLGGASCNTTNAGYFKITDSEWSVLNDSTHKGKIDAALWVAGTYNSGTLSTGVGTNATGGKAPDDSNRGTKSQPYATIKKAVEQCWSTSKTFTINIDGTLGGAQTVPAKNTTNNTGLASEIILNGNTLSNTSTAILNGGFASLGDDNHTLKIDTAVSVSIRNLKIIKGWATNGGGVYISSDSTVYMSGGVVVTENKATSGGGIANYGKLLIFGDARIGGTGTGTATASTGNYATNLGGGILNAGKLYLGYDVYTDFQNAHVAEFTGGITQNYAIGKSGNTVNAGKGGGIYNANANGECVIKSGNVSYNYSWVGGGIYSAKTLTMHGGSIGNNTATYSDDDSPSGGGVYAYSSTFTMSGGNISGNKASSHGGGVGLVGAKLYMYGSAVIGTSADTYATGSNACSNYAAKNGGGVYAANDDNTSVLLGYTNASNVADTFDGGISYNCCGDGFNGGGIYYSGKEANLKIAKGYIRYNNALNGEGGGICCNSKNCIISGGNIYSNHAKFGGGISLTGGSIEMSAGSIYKNSANNGGGGVHVSNTSGSSFTMSGGIIGGTSGNENTSVTDMGGAIYAQKDITFAGGASVPYNGTAKKNDVCLGNGIKIAVTGNNVPSGSNVATIVPYSYNTTSQVMGSDSASAASSKFKVRPDSTGAAWFIETTGKLTKGISLSAADAISEIANLKSSSTLQITGSISTQQFNSIESALMSLYTADNTKRITLDLSKSSITSIPQGAFNTEPNTTGGCNVLSSVILPTTVTTIGEDAFQGCSNLTSITGLDNVTTLGKACFMGCNFSNFTIPPKVTVIPEEAFYHCGVLGTITIPEKVTTIGKNAFGCTYLTSVTFEAPNKVTSIGEGAFHYCNFTSFSIPSGITVIEKSTFANCGSLTSITIPSNIKTIYASAFHYSSIGSTHLTAITISTTGWKLNGTTATDMSSASANVAKFTVYNSSDYYSR